MPELKKVTVQVQKVMVGDVFNRSGRGGGFQSQHEIADVKVGRKWVTARDTEGKLAFEKPVDEEIEVARWELTEEEVAERNAELAEEKRASMNTAIENWATWTIEDLEENLLECVSKITKGYSDQYSTMMAYQAKAQIASEIKNIVEIGNKEDRNEEFWGEFGAVVDWVSAYELWKAETTKALLAEYSFRANRRDAFEDVKREVTLKVLHRADYGFWSNFNF